MLSSTRPKRRSDAHYLLRCCATLGATGAETLLLLTAYSVE